MKKPFRNQKSNSDSLQTMALKIKRPALYCILLWMLFLCSLTGIQKVQAQTYGPALFTEDFGTVPAGQDVNKYRGDITGRGNIGNIYWLWPRTCSGAGWMTLSPPTLEQSHALTLPAGEQGVTEWSFVQVTVLNGTPYTGSYLNNPAYTWCLTGTIWTGPNPGTCSGILVRWYNVCGTWKLGNWERYRLRQSVACASWHSVMDDGGYALSTNPRYVHSPNEADGSDLSWHDGPDHTADDVNGMMLIVNAALEKGLFYTRKITGLCYGAQFEYKSYYANVLKTSACGGIGIDINIRYEIWDRDPGSDESNSLVPIGGTACNGASLLAQTNTGNVGESPTLTWYTTSLIVNVPQNQDSIFIILRNNGPGGCGNDLAIDDITFRPYIPFTLGYERIPTDYCTTGMIRLQGTLISGSIPSNYVFQWQEAEQGTTNWVDIGSPTDFANAFIDLDIGTIGNKIYRIISAASVQNLNNTNCYVASTTFDGNSIVLPTGSLTATADVCGTVGHTPIDATFTVNYQGNIFPWTYYYKINGGTEQSQIVNSPNISDTKTIAITDNTIVTLVKISTVDCDVLINSDKLIIYSTDVPGIPIEITGPNPACIGSEADFEVSEVQGAITYTWVVSSDWEIISGQGTRFVRLKIGSTAITVTVYISNACGNSDWTSESFFTSNLPPPAPADITTPNGICLPESSIPGNTDILFEATLVNGVQNYIWSWDSPVELGTQQSGTGQYLRKIILSVPNNVTSFNVRVKSQNECGYSADKEETFYPDNIPPDITCPGPLNAVCSITEVPAYANYAAFTAAGGSATDAISGINTVSFGLLSEDSNGETCPAVFTRTYKIEDNCGHQQTCSQTITVDDNVNPSLTCPTPPTAVCNITDVTAYADYAAFTVAGGSASDNCAINPASFNHVGDADDGLTCPKTITRTYQIADLCGNTATCTQTIIVDDIVNPSLTCPAAPTAVCSITEVPAYAGYAAFIADGGSASDNCAINPASFSHVGDSDDGLTCPKTITRTYQIADLCGNTATCIQTITVDDIVNPSLTCPTAPVAVCSITEVPVYADYAAFTADGGSASDNCAINTDSFIHVGDADDGLTCPITITRTYRIADLCGNTAICTQTIVVDDNVNPSLTCPDGLLAVCEPPASYDNYNAFNAAGGLASDNCAINEASFEWVSDVSDNNTNPEIVTRTYRIEDICGNEATCEQIITIHDIMAETYVYLEGSAINPGGSQVYTLPMRISLNTVKVLPGQTYYNFMTGNVFTPPGQPYSGAPWFYGGNEGASYNSGGNPYPGTAGYPSTVVDWVLVSLRSTPDGDFLCQKAALLHNDGHLEFVARGFDCCDLNFSGSYYLVIEHRNHLIVMSPEPVPVINGTLTYDFRSHQSYIDDPFGFGGFGQKEILPGIFAMFAGNGDQVKTGSDLEGDDVGINFNDRTYWEGQNNTAGRYRNGDYNLNGDCNYNDRITWELNNGKFTTVPRD